MTAATSALLRWGVWFQVLLAAVAVLSALYAHDRGFDISDEAYYVLSASRPDSIRAYISPQHWLLAPLWQISGDLARFRLVGLAILIASSAVLALGITAVARRLNIASPPPFASTFSLSLIGAILYLTTINLSPSYNLLASAGCSCAVGFSLGASASSRVARIGVLAALAGLALTAMFVSKPSAAICTLLILPLFLWAMSGRVGKTALIWAVIAAAFGASLIGITLLQGTWPETRAALADGYALFRIVQGEPIADRLLRYAREYLVYAGWMLIAFLPFVLLFGCYLVRPGAKLAWACLIALASSLLFNDRMLSGALIGTNSHLPQIEALLLIVLASVALASPALRADWRLAALVTGLFVAPYGVAIGTGNAIFTQVIVTMAPWAALMAISPGLPAIGSSRFLSLGLTSLFALTASSQIATYAFRPAYHLVAPLTAQTERVPIGALGTVRVDPATAAFVADLQVAAATCRIGPDLPYLGIYDVPGVALVFHAVPVASPWINNPAQAAAILTPERLAALGPVIVARRIGWDRVWPDLPAGLGTVATDFMLCGTASYPFGDQKMEIWFRR